MSAQVAEDQRMTDESRIAKVEAHVAHTSADVTDIKGEVRSVRTALESLNEKFHDFKTEVAKDLGAIREAIESLRTAQERTKLWMVVTGSGLILSFWGAVFMAAHWLRP